MNILMVFLALGLGVQEARPAAESSGESLVFRKAFHVIGVPGLKRNNRVDLAVTASRISLSSGRGATVQIPFERIEKVTFLSGERHYGKTFATAVAAFGVAGTLVMLKKRKVDTLALDYRNERGGLMGVVLQLPLGEGARCRQWLERFSVKVEEPEAEETPQP